MDGPAGAASARRRRAARPGPLREARVRVENEAVPSRRAASARTRAHTRRRAPRARSGPGRTPGLLLAQVPFVFGRHTRGVRGALVGEHELRHRIKDGSTIRKALFVDRGGGSIFGFASWDERDAVFCATVQNAKNALGRLKRELYPEIWNGAPQKLRELVLASDGERSAAPARIRVIGPSSRFGLSDERAVWIPSASGPRPPKTRLARRRAVGHGRRRDRPRLLFAPRGAPQPQSAGRALVFVGGRPIAWKARDDGVEGGWTLPSLKFLDEDARELRSDEDRSRQPGRVRGAPEPVGQRARRRVAPHRVVPQNTASAPRLRASAANPPRI